MNDYNAQIGPLQSNQMISPEVNSALNEQSFKLTFSWHYKECHALLLSSMILKLQFRRRLVTWDLESLIVTKSMIEDPNRVNFSVLLTIFSYSNQTSLRFLFDHVNCNRQSA